jgi:hypothetical protein
LFVYLAREAPIGVVLRRGPSAWARLSVWHTDTDSFEHGQWFKGRVYERRSDVSADGSLFVYFAFQSGGHVPSTEAADSWIAISRPPWFTALALWFVGGTYCTGGFFPDRRSVFPGWVGAPSQGRLPPWLAVTGQIPYVDRTNNWTDRTVSINRRLRDGWTPVPHTPAEMYETWERRHPREPLKLVMTEMHTGFAFHPYGGPYIVEYAVRAEHQGAVIPLGQATWADWDQQGRLVIAQQGRLLHWQPTGTPRELADFNPQTPAPAASPPRARTWPRPPRAR